MTSLDLLSKYLLIMELRFGVILCSNLVTQSPMRAIPNVHRTAFRPKAAGSPPVVYSILILIFLSNAIFWLKRFKPRAPEIGRPKILGVRIISSISICIFVLVRRTFFNMPLTQYLYRRMSAKNCSE